MWLLLMMLMLLIQYFAYFYLDSLTDLFTSVTLRMSHHREPIKSYIMLRSVGPLDLGAIDLTYVVLFPNTLSLLLLLSLLHSLDLVVV